MRSLYSLLAIDASHPRSFSWPLVTSWAIGPPLLASVRLILAFYAFLVIFADYGLSPSDIGHSFSYFTDLTYWGISFYALIAGIHTILYAVRGRCWLETWPRSLRALHSFFYTTVVTLPFIVTLAYWVLLYQDPYYPQASKQWRDVRSRPLEEASSTY